MSHLTRLENARHTPPNYEQFNTYRWTIAITGITALMGLVAISVGGSSTNSSNDSMKEILMPAGILLIGIGSLGYGYAATKIKIISKACIAKTPPASGKRSKNIIHVQSYKA